MATRVTPGYGGMPGGGGGAASKTEEAVIKIAQLQEEMQERVDEAFAKVGMTAYAKHEPHRLSGGQKQLLNLASIMAMQPEVLILDEPTSQLDPIAASDFLNTVRKININHCYITKYTSFYLFLSIGKVRY